MAGHNVKTCMGRDKHSKQRIKTGDGLIEKIENEEWAKWASWADLITCSDNNRWLRELDVFRKKGYPVFAPSYESSQLELDRGKGQALLKKNGIEVMDYEVFSDYKAAEKYVLAEQKRFVSKPMGDADRALSYVSQSPKDMVFMLRRWAKTNKLSGQFLIQEFTPGVEFSATGWLGKQGFARFVNEGFEHKKLMNDEKGPNTGEMGTAIRYVENSTLAKEVLLPLERDLIKLGHTGQIDVSVIVDEDGTPRPLEFTARCSWPCTHIMQQLHPEPCEWMVDLLDGNDSFTPSTEVAIGVVVAIPPFPTRNGCPPSELDGIPLYGLDDDNPLLAGVAPCEVMSGTAPDDKGVEQRALVSCGDYLAVCTGLGKTVRAAQAQAYATVDTLQIPKSPMYRTDIGSRLKDDIPALQDFGFAKDWTW